MNSDSGGKADLTSILPPASQLVPAPDRSGGRPSSSGGRADLTSISPHASQLVPAPDRSGGRPILASIVILGWNQAAYTKLCVESVQRHTPEPHELILVDNGSSDDSAAFMQSVPGARVILNPANRGFAGGSNQGLRAARGRWLVLLNNDTIVTKGWLGRLVAHAERDPATGMVGPVSNYVATDAQRVAADYPLDELQKFAVLHARRHAGQGEETDFLSGVCWLIRREVIEGVGLLDESFLLGGFEDNDFCQRVRAAGWRLRIARDVFIHHFGSRSFEGNRLDRARIQDENGRRFAEKWGVAVRSADGSRWILPAELEQALDYQQQGDAAAALRCLERHLARFPHDEAVAASAAALREAVHQTREKVTP